MSTAAEARIPVMPQTRDRLRAAKRGNQTYDDLVREMLEQYDPGDYGGGKY